jgi:hypothetical protein
MRSYLRESAIIFTALCIVTLALNYFVFQIWFRLRDAPINPLAVNLFTVFSLIVCVLMALVFSGVVVKTNMLSKKKTGFIILLVIAYSTALFYFYPIEIPLDDNASKVEIKIR